jgi:hypothetical protein
MHGKTWLSCLKPQNGPSINILADCRKTALLSTLLPVEAYFRPKVKRDLWDADKIMERPAEKTEGKKNARATSGQPQDEHQK